MCARKFADSYAWRSMSSGRGSSRRDARSPSPWTCYARSAPSRMARASAHTRGTPSRPGLWVARARVRAEGAPVGVWGGEGCSGALRRAQWRRARFASRVVTEGVLAGKWKRREPLATLYLARPLPQAGILLIKSTPLHALTADSWRAPLLNRWLFILCAL